MLVAASILGLGSCTGGRPPAASGSGTPSGAPAALEKVCRDYAATRASTLALLERLAAGSETVARFADDGDALDLAARELYADVAPLATRADPAFRLITSVTTDMFHLLFGEFQEFRIIDPADVDPRAVDALRAGLDEVDRAIATGVVACPSSG